MIHYVTQRSPEKGTITKVRLFSDGDEAQDFILKSNGVHANADQAEVAVYNGAKVCDHTDGGDEATREVMRLKDIERSRDAIEAYCEDCHVEMDGILGWWATKDALDTWPEGGAWGHEVTAVIHLSSGTTDPTYYEWPWQLAADVYAMMVQDSGRGADPRDTVWAEAVDDDVDEG